MTEIKRTYRYYVKPTERMTDEAFSAWLSQNNITPLEVQINSIRVDGKEVYGVYHVPYAFITVLKHSEHRDKGRIYVKEGSGSIRPFTLYDRREQQRSKPVRRVAQQIALRTRK